MEIIHFFIDFSGVSDFFYHLKSGKSARVGYPTFGREQAQAEVEFLHRCRDGEIVPVEVKSGARTRARSLRSYVERYEPRRAIKLIGGPGGERVGRVETWPLYYVQYLRDL